MMDFNSYQIMMGGGAWVFMWVMYIIVMVVLVLSAMALWKYINKK